MVMGCDASGAKAPMEKLCLRRCDAARDGPAGKPHDLQPDQRMGSIAFWMDRALRHGPPGLIAAGCWVTHNLVYGIGAACLAVAVTMLVTRMWWGVAPDNDIHDYTWLQTSAEVAPEMLVYGVLGLLMPDATLSDWRFAAVAVPVVAATLWPYAYFQYLQDFRHHTRSQTERVETNVCTALCDFCRDNTTVPCRLR
jgi:hypothetical protein